MKWRGRNSTRSLRKERTSDDSEKASPRVPAPMTENHFSQTDKVSSNARSTDGNTRGTQAQQFDKARVSFLDDDDWE